MKAQAKSATADYIPDIERSVERLDAAFSELESRLLQVKKPAAPSRALEELKAENATLRKENAELYAFLEPLEKENDALHARIAELATQLESAIAKTESVLRKLEDA
jgi:FtsZ-binding cell division protein ZapB